MAGCKISEFFVLDTTAGKILAGGSMAQVQPVYDAAKGGPNTVAIVTGRNPVEVSFARQPPPKKATKKAGRKTLSDG